MTPALSTYTKHTCINMRIHAHTHTHAHTHITNTPRLDRPQRYIHTSRWRRRTSRRISLLYNRLQRVYVTTDIVQGVSSDDREAVYCCCRYLYTPAKNKLGLVGKKNILKNCNLFEPIICTGILSFLKKLLIHNAIKFLVIIFLFYWQSLLSKIIVIWYTKKHKSLHNMISW